jgi:Predicted ATPase
MAEDTETIRVGATSDGVAADEPAGVPVQLPVVDLMTGRGFATGKSGAGKSNTVSVVIEKLLDRGLPVMVVDIDGEYYGLKEDYEILHVGADEACDLVVNEEHAGKLAELALEQNVPIILDVSSFLDESEARDLLTAVARNLFAKEKKLKQPFLLVIEEVHEYIPEGGGLDECGRMLIKAAKRGRKHGLGVVGVSQRPADVKKDFITQCDWLVWHRLTWENDTKVVRRILGSEYADAIDGMGDGEAFVLLTGPSGSAGSSSTARRRSTRARRLGSTTSSGPNSSRSAATSSRTWRPSRRPRSAGSRESRSWSVRSRIRRTASRNSSRNSRRRRTSRRWPSGSRGR